MTCELTPGNDKQLVFPEARATPCTYGRLEDALQSQRGEVSITIKEIALEDERLVRTRVMLKTKSKHEFSQGCTSEVVGEIAATIARPV